MAAQETFADYEAIEGMAKTLEAVGDALDVASKVLIGLIAVATAASKVPIVGQFVEAIKQYLENLKPHVDQVAQLSHGANTDLVNWVKIVRDGDTSLTSQFAV